MATSSRNVHFTKKQCFLIKYIFNEFSFAGTFCTSFYVELDKVPYWELHQGMATSSRNGHFIKKWPLHQEMATSSRLLVNFLLMPFLCNNFLHFLVLFNLDFGVCLHGNLHWSSTLVLVNRLTGHSWSCQFFKVLLKLFWAKATDQ